MKEEDLSSPVQLVIYYAFYLIFVEQYNLGLGGYPVRRRSVYYGKVPGAQKRELEGPRNRCSCKGEGVHRRLYLAQLLLGRDSELLFLVYYKQAEVFEFEALSKHLVGTYDYIQGPVLQLFLDGGDFLGRPKPADIVHGTRKILEA